MIANIVTGEDGAPIDGGGNKLSLSAYQPIPDVQKLFEQVQTDYLTAWRLQHRPFREFDNVSLLERTRLDQETFGAYVGVQITADPKNWRWKGRKNTSRNKIIGTLAHVLAGMLFPVCYAYNDENKEDKMTARVMRLLIENHLKKANYEIKFVYMALTALVQPAVIMNIEYVEAMQKVKQKMADGTYKIHECVDTILSGLNMNNVPIDQFLPADYYTSDIQRQPFNVRLRRIPWDEARKIYQGKFTATVNGEKKDPFDFVQAGKTRVFLAGQEYQTLYDIEWTEADRNFVQEITMYYRPEDLEVTFVGGVFMGNEEDIYNSNPFKHRRMALINNSEWISVPVYPYAKSGFEPLDPTGRFFYYKSAANKEYWDDAGQNRMHQLAYDGTFLDVIKPLFISGVTKIDGTVLLPGATIGIPQGARVDPYQLGPNLVAALKMMQVEKDDLGDSVINEILGGNNPRGGVTAFATAKADQNARTVLGLFGIMIADLVKQIGELTMDISLMYDTIGVIDATIPSSLKMKYQAIISKSKEGGRDITNRIEFDSGLMGDNITPEKADKLEWDLFEQAGGINTDQHVYKVNPYKLARHKFSLYVDADLITSKSMGTDQMKKDRAFQILTNPAIAPFTDPEAVADDYIESVSDGDPDKFKKKGNTALPPGAVPTSPQFNPQMSNQGGGQVVLPGQNNQQQ